MKKKILVVCPFFPYPTTFGGVFDTWERIKGLSQLGCEIDLLYANKSLPDDDDLEYVKGFVNEVYGVQRKNKWYHLFGLKPLQVISRNKLIKVYLKKTYDEVIFESESVASVLKNKTLKAKKRILRVHNDEHNYFKNLSKSSPHVFKKIFYYIEGVKFFHFSRKIFNEFDRLWYISADEEKKYRLRTKRKNSLHVPPPINDDFISKKPDNKNVLFVGSLYMDNNFEAIKLYLDNVHSYICEVFKDYNLIICGSTGDNSEELYSKRLGKYERIQTYFNVKDIESVYSMASFFVNPMQNGAGVKLKSINAIVNGLLLIATTTGSEGIGLIDEKMFFLANTPSEFRTALINALKSDPNQIVKIIDNAQNFLKSNSYIDILKNELSL